MGCCWLDVGAAAPHFRCFTPVCIGSMLPTQHCGRGQGAISSLRWQIVEVRPAIPLLPDAHPRDPTQKGVRAAPSHRWLCRSRQGYSERHSRPCGCGSSPRDSRSPHGRPLRLMTYAAQSAAQPTAQSAPHIAAALRSRGSLRAAAHARPP